jgi:hypothetical protein
MMGQDDAGGMIAVEVRAIPDKQGGGVSPC